MELRGYIDANGRRVFRQWYSKLNSAAAMQINRALDDLQRGAAGKAKSIGQGVHELRIHHGPGYRVYFGNDGDLLVILLGGGTKKRQEHDIAQAKERWREYKKRKSVPNEIDGKL